VLFAEVDYQTKLVSSRGNKSAIAFRTWSLKNLLTSHLKTKKIDFFQTAFLNYLTSSALIKNNTDSDFHKTFSYLVELEKINLSSTLDNWIELSDNEYLGDFAFHMKQMHPDKVHPSNLGHKIWTKMILIPKLKNIGIVM
jgi:lysophospholipase L1-like esterase